MKNSSLKSGGKILVTVLRVAIGWHFLFEGLTKMMAVGWSAESYLANATGFLSGFYKALAASPALLKIVDLLNIYGLVLIGLALFTGILVRWAASAGVLLLALYYFAYPPFGGFLFGSPEGQMFIVNKIFIETAALLVLIFIHERGYGIDNLVAFFSHREEAESAGEDPLYPGQQEAAVTNSRREVLKNLVTLPVLGAMGWGTFNMHKKYGVDVMSGATIQLNQASLSELKGELPKGKIGPHEITRLVLGGNLIGGWAHSRDLIYVNSLFKAYNTEQKIFETLILAERAGINAINIGGGYSNQLLEKYKKTFGSKIKVISQVSGNRENNDFTSGINRMIDYGVDIIQVQGNQCDFLVRDNEVDKIAIMIDHIRSQGITAGLGAHTIDAFIACNKYGIIPDYYMVTMHHDQYWSAHPRDNRIPFEVDTKKHPEHDRFHDNMFCLFPDQAIEFVENCEVPVMGFKVLAAGAIRPENGFNWAFKNGADFICVGMFDFQIVNDVNICLDTLNNLDDRKRKWFA